MKNSQSILKEWEITEQELTDLVNQNPSLRGMLLGYIAEHKFQKLFLDDPKITATIKDDDHDRTKKGDRRIIYKGKSFTIEVKSLQTHTIKKISNTSWEGKAQVDGSDRRIVTFEDGTELNTTLLLRGEFDILAVNCFAFENKWRFAFCRNSDLPISTFKKYSQIQREHLVASLIPVTWPPKPPFTDNLFKILNAML
ncbi:MAG: hypothetical protein LBK00_06620 [Treponema sp.]|jgi:hypothetical protein|nr:hypothetical protein [Treponema sp.]